MTGAKPWPIAEMVRMVEEKQKAALLATTAALAPYRRATRANARRLGRQRH
jgi:hypothetical protein